MDHRCHRGRPCISHVRHCIRHNSGNATQCSPQADFMARYQLVTIPLIGARVRRYGASSVVTESKMTERGPVNFHPPLNMTMEEAAMD